MKKLLLFCLILSITFLYVAVVFADDAAKSDTVNGWVSDSKCGAKGANAGAAACTKKCIAAGEKPGVVSDADQKVYSVENPDARNSCIHQHGVCAEFHRDGRIRCSPHAGI